MINNSYHLNCGTLGVKYIFDALSDNGYAEIAYKMVVNPEYPSYAYWINNGMTTLCESWDMTSSLNHHMFSEIETWFYKHLGGIRYTDTGLVISPVYLKSVNYVKVHHKGICVERSGDQVTITLDTMATIVIDKKVQAVAPGVYRFRIIPQRTLESHK